MFIAENDMNVPEETLPGLSMDSGRTKTSRTAASLKGAIHRLAMNSLGDFLRNQQLGEVHFVQQLGGSNAVQQFLVSCETSL
jgi:hypothetical protein